MRRAAQWLLALLLLAVVGLGLAKEPQHTLTTSVGAPLYLGVTYEYDLIPDPYVEVALGFQVQGDIVDGERFPSVMFRPYAVIGYYPDTGSVWVEFNLPEGIVPGLGDGDKWFSLYTQYRW